MDDPIVIVPGERIERVLLAGCTYQGDRLRELRRPTTDSPYWRLTLSDGSAIEATEAIVFLSPIEGGAV